MTEENKNLPIKLAPILEKVNVHVPRMIAGRDKAVARMSQIVSIETDEDVEEANGVLVKAKTASDTFESWRKEITGPLDEFKKELMVYEKDVKEQDTRIRGLVQAYKQAKVEAQRKAEEAAAKKKAIENHKVDIQTQVKKNLTQLWVDTAVKTEDWCKKFWDDTTLENFNDRATQFKNVKPGLKRELYDKCFNVQYNPSLLTSVEYSEWISICKDEEPYDKWMGMVVEGITPILKQWRDGIESIRDQKQDLAEADGEEKERIAREQKEQADRDQAEKDKMFKEAQQNALAEIEQEAEVNKIGNSFVEQAVVQSLDEVGPTKKILRFNDDKLFPKAFANVIVQCLMSKNFPGIYKLDKNKQPVIDAAGNKEYIDGVKFWAEFFIKHCDANIQGTEVKDVAKVIVRR